MAEVSAISCERSGSQFLNSSSNSERPSSPRTSPIFASATSAPVTMSLWRSLASAWRSAGTILPRMSACEGTSVFAGPSPRKSDVRTLW